MTENRVDYLPINKPNGPETSDKEDSTRKYNSLERVVSVVFDECTMVTIILTMFCTALFIMYVLPDWGAEVVTEPLPDGNTPKPEKEIFLNSLIISEFKASDAQITGKCDVTFGIDNDHGRSRYQQSAVVSIFLGHELLWVTRTGDLFLEEGKRVMYNVSINKTTVSVPASIAPTTMLQGRKLHRTIKFKVKYDGNLREGLAAWQEDRVHLYVVCGWLEMRFIDETTLSGGPTKCFTEYNF